jgi:hypothetical protein
MQLNDDMRRLAPRARFKSCNFLPIMSARKPN